jgi:hypothetical protein
MLTRAWWMGMLQAPLPPSPISMWKTPDATPEYTTPPVVIVGAPEMLSGLSGPPLTVDATAARTSVGRKVGGVEMASAASSPKRGGLAPRAL